MLKAIDKPLLMGILNITPDSFSDGGRYSDVQSALKQCRRLLDEGADIIDIGGESSRPGADSVAAQEQIFRVVPVIQAIRQHLQVDVPISIDTTLSAVAAAALDAGATIINDISAGLGDANMLSFVAEKNVPIILMHMAGTPKTMQDNPYYADVVAEVLALLQQRIDAALQAGVSPQNIVIDPGIGFGKRTQDNIDLLAHLQRFADLGYPLLLGTSRKRFMGNICHVDNPEELVVTTAVTTALGVMAGVKIFRVHDVKPNRQALDVAWEIRKATL